MAAAAVAVPPGAVLRVAARVDTPWGDAYAAVGCAFLIAHRLALTCAHVVNSACGREVLASEPPDAQVIVDFPLLDSHRRLEAAVRSWSAPNEHDVAVLKLPADLPAEATAAPLTSAADVFDHEFATYGFPESFERGVWAFGRLRLPVARGWVQIEDIKAQGRSVEGGFSGAPVWDQALEAVVGLVVGADLDRATKTAFMVPTDSAAKLWDDVAPLLRPAPASVRRRERRTDRLFRYAPPLRVRETDPYAIGVTPSAIATAAAGDDRPLYIRRDVDGEVDRALRDTRFVLIVGRSKAGKSRTAYEAAARELPDSAMLVPATPSVLPKLLAALGDVEGATELSILWLDDLQDYLDASSLNVAMLERLGKLPLRVVVVATMRGADRARLRESAGELGRNAKEVLALATTIELDADDPGSWNANDAAELYPGVDFAGGIGSAFTSRQELLEKYRDGADGWPAGVALVRAAIDWRRAGLVRPVPEADLIALAPAYLRGSRANKDELRAGLEWANAPAASSARLLASVDQPGGGGWKAFDALLEPDEGERLAPLPAATWQAILTRMQATEGVDVGRAAEAHGELEVAEDAFRRAADAGEPDGAFSLGVLLDLERDDLEAAVPWYRQAWEAWYARAEAEATELGDGYTVSGAIPGKSLLALRRLGTEARGRDVHEEAERWFRKLAELDPRQSYSLGKTLLDLGRADEAKNWLAKAAGERAPRLGPDDRAAAAWALAGLALKDDDTAEYKVWVRRAAELGYEPAAMMLVMLLRGSGDSEARQWLERLAGSPNATLAADAAHHLGELAHDDGDHEEAERQWRKAAQGDGMFAGKASLNLGILLYRRGKHHDAARAWERAAASAEDEVRGEAGRLLALLDAAGADVVRPDG